MANKLLTAFQRLDSAINGQWDTAHNNTYQITPSDKTIYKAKDKIDYAHKKLELQQNAYLKDKWLRTNRDLTLQAFSGLNNLKLMYRDADLMDAFPEIGAALTIVAEESTCLNQKGQIVNVFSKSDRVKTILEDLLVNRLDIQMTAPMIIRGMCKYGNQFMYLNIDKKNGILGWRQLPVYNVERLENGIVNPYGSQGLVVGNAQQTNNEDTSTQFVWVGEQNQPCNFRNWQIGHFRLLTDSLFWPYGCSYLNSARRHWRMLSIMEDLMLIYRLERSIERRVYKIFVGNIDDADVQAYVEEIANNFKRTPIVDPQTGQLDLRKNLMDVSQDIFIPTRDPNAATPIDTLSAAQNLTALDDIKFIQNKVFTALGIPKTFLNFEEAAGDGKNLALMDIRFTRKINRVQQAFLMELTKIASIHLYLLGFEDEITNFTLSMNNPSTQAEQLEIDNLQKKIGAIRDAVSDPGNGIPIMSLTRALKEIMKWSDKEIKENLEEIRLEKGLAAELEKTTQIIQKTGVFDTVDRIYGEPGAEYQEGGQQGANGGDMGGGGPMGGGGGGMPPMDDGGLDGLGIPGGEEEGDISGAEGEMPMDEMPQEGGGNEIPMESVKNKKPLIVENTSRLFNDYLSKMDNKNNRQTIIERPAIFDKALMINEEFDAMIKQLDNIDLSHT